jgi:hypothetical protein
MQAEESALLGTAIKQRLEELIKQEKNWWFVECVKCRECYEHL